MARSASTIALAAARRARLADGLARFDREARASALLRSAHVARVLDVDAPSHSAPARRNAWPIVFGVLGVFLALPALLAVTMAFAYQKQSARAAFAPLPAAQEPGSARASAHGVKAGVAAPKSPALPVAPSADPLHL